MRWLLTLALLASCHHAPDAPADAAPPGLRLLRVEPASCKRLGIVVAPAGEASPAARIELPGTLEYDLERYAEVGALQEGRITSVTARVGDHVRRGEGLATMVVPRIAQAQAEYLQAKAELDLSRTRAARETGLLAKQLTTASEAETAEAGALHSSAALQAARARLEVMDAAPPRAGVPLQPGVVTLHAPLAGVVVKRDAVLGQFVTQSEPLFVVADPTTLWATFNVFASDLAYLHVGIDVAMTFDSLPGLTLHGQVALMEPQLEGGSRALRARVSVANLDGALRPGLFVRAHVALPQPTGTGLLVPSAAVQPLGEADVVFVAHEPGVFEVRAVKVGTRTPQVVEVEDGLRRGEAIAMAGTFLLRAEATKQ